MFVGISRGSVIYRFTHRELNLRAVYLKDGYRLTVCRHRESDFYVFISRSEKVCHSVYGINFIVPRAVFKRVFSEIRFSVIDCAAREFAARFYGETIFERIRLFFDVFAYIGRKRIVSVRFYVIEINLSFIRYDRSVGITRGGLIEFFYRPLRIIVNEFVPTIRFDGFALVYLR